MLKLGKRSFIPGSFTIYLNGKVLFRRLEVQARLLDQIIYTPNAPNTCLIEIIKKITRRNSYNTINRVTGFVCNDNRSFILRCVQR